jgi:CRP-like cAMP-binding protein
MKLTAKYMEILLKVSLFDGIAQNELEALLSCIGARQKIFLKDDYIINAGDDVTGVGIVLAGSVQVFKEDKDARRTILAGLSIGDIFQEVLACAGIKKSPVTVLATSSADILFVDYEKIVHSCANSCNFHSRLISNMLRILAGKNLDLNKKIDFLSIKSLRERLTAYLLEQSTMSMSRSFELPFDRSGVADYLNADRSAVSRELSRMKQEGLIDYYKNSFKLLDL